MRKVVWMLVMLPVLSLAAAPPSPGASAPGAGRAGEPDRARRHMRLARTLGLAEALELDDAATLRARDVLARSDERRAPLHRQLREDREVLRDAARGERSAAGQVDTALNRMRETRAQLQKLDAEAFGQLTQGMTPERKARAALFLAEFRQRELVMAHEQGARRARRPASG